jgi:Predicted methyltransferase regulatory domain/Methyltransferase domain
MNPYDLTPWPGEGCAASHPDSVGAIARVFGLRSAAVERCRVLELGCAAGANLVPMAAAFPEASFVGVDLSAAQVRAGRAEVEALGLKNLTLREADIAALPTGLGTFDYVLVHGVFSWVPRAVQEGVFSCLRTCLAEHGVGFVSYSALPGAHARMALGEMLRWHVRGETNLKRRVERARRFAEQLAVYADSKSGTAAALRKLVGELGGLSDAQVLHDHLAEAYQPLSLSSFAARAAEHRLQYLADAQFHSMFADALEPEVAALVREGAEDQVALEQALDFFQHRPFRTSLLCHTARSIDRTLSWGRLDGLCVSSSAQREDGEAAFSFRARGGEAFGTDDEVVGPALVRVTSAWPRPVAFAELCSPADREVLGANLLAAASANQVQLGLSARRIAPVGDRPVALASARAQAARGLAATNLWHQTVALEPAQRALLPLLDGSRERSALDGGVLASLARQAFLLDVVP